MASPWTRRVGTDIGEAAKSNEDEADWLEELSEAPWKLEADNDLANRFALLDFARVRASKQMVQIPPPAFGTRPTEEDDVCQHEEMGPMSHVFVCGVPLGDGSRCKARYETRRQLLHRQRSAHYVRSAMC